MKEGPTQWSQRQAILRGSYRRFIFIHEKTNPINDKGVSFSFLEVCKQKPGNGGDWAGCSLIPSPALGRRDPQLLLKTLHGSSAAPALLQVPTKTDNLYILVLWPPSSPSLFSPALQASGRLCERPSPRPTHTHSYPSASVLADPSSGISSSGLLAVSSHVSPIAQHCTPQPSTLWH